MGAGCKVEERCLAAVGVAHQGYVDYLASAQGGIGQLLVGNVAGWCYGCHAGGVCQCGCGQGHVYLVGSHHLYMVGLAAPQRHLVAQYLIFYRVLQGGVLEHFHHLAFDETHLHNTLAETSMTGDLDDHPFFSCLQFR